MPPAYPIDNAFPRLIVALIGIAAVWLLPSRRSTWGKAGITAGMLFATFMWSLSALVVGAIIAGALVWLGRARKPRSKLDGFLKAAAGEDAADDVDQPSAGLTRRRTVTITACAAGLVLLGIALAGLEIQQPYYFCQDDMRVDGTPALRVQFREVWKGVWPQYNPYMLMGEPVGGPTYPPAYLAYAISRHILHDEVAQVDVSAILHIVAGYFVFFFIARRVGMGPVIASVASLSVVLSGSTLVMGRGWPMYIDAVVWVPLLLYAVFRAARGPVGWRWALLTAGTVAMLGHVGFAQLWVTALLGAALLAAAMWALGQMPWRQLMWVGAAMTLGAAVAVPIYYQQWVLAADLINNSRSEAGIGVGLLDLLLPYPLAQAPHPIGWGGMNSLYMGEMYYIGALFVLATVLALAAVFTARDSRRTWAGNIWALLAGVVFLLALGPDLGVWKVMGAVPVLNVVNHFPFRMLPFLAMLSALAGGVTVERLLRRIRHKSLRFRWELGLAATTIALLLCHTWYSRAAFYYYGFPADPGALPPALAAHLHPDSPHPEARIMTWAPLRSATPQFASALPLNLPMLYQLPAFGGYSILMENKPTWQAAAAVMNSDPLRASRAYGVRWHLVSPLIWRPVFSSDAPANQALEQAVPEGEGLDVLLASKPRQVAHTPEVALLDVGPVDPLAFPAGHPERPLPITTGGAGIDVDLASLGALKGATSVVVNWLWYPQIVARMGGQRLKCSHDDWGRIVVTLPPDLSSVGILHVGYSPDWTAGLTIGAVMAGVALLVMAFFRPILSPSPSVMRKERLKPVHKRRIKKIKVGVISNHAEK